MAIIVLSLMTYSLVNLGLAMLWMMVEYEVRDETGCTFLHAFFFLLICILSVLYSSVQPCYICSNFWCKDWFIFFFENLSSLIFLRLAVIFHHPWLQQ